MNEDIVKGSLDKVTGKIKETVGHLTHDKELETKGKLDQVKGSAQEALGRVKDATKKVAENVDKHTR